MNLFSFLFFLFSFYLIVQFICLSSIRTPTLPRLHTHEASCINRYRYPGQHPTLNKPSCIDRYRYPGQHPTLNKPSCIGRYRYPNQHHILNKPSCIDRYRYAGHHHPPYLNHLVWIIWRSDQHHSLKSPSLCRTMMCVLSIKHKTEQNAPGLSEVPITLSLYPWTCYRLNTNQKLHQASLKSPVAVSMDLLSIKYKPKIASGLSKIAITLSLYPWTCYRLKNTNQKLHQASLKSP